MNKKVLIIGAVIIALAVIAIVRFFLYGYLFGAPQRIAAIEQFTIPLDASQQIVLNDLQQQGFIKNTAGFNIALGGKKLQPGGYEISKSMDAFAVAKVLGKKPSLVWVVIPEGLRKEQIAGILQKDLGWTNAQVSDWVENITTQNPDYIEGVYFPDTYLIPVNSTPTDVAQRLIDQFNESFAPYAAKFLAANIKWTTALKIASIVQREGLGSQDMPLIAGIIWNRLAINMPLDIDATVQYARDNQIHYSGNTYMSAGTWWTPIMPADEQINSPYNTYLNAGLPPTPISNPGLEAIDATLNSTNTPCLYYLHDTSGQIHCAVTYQEQEANVQKYLQ